MINGLEIKGFRGIHEGSLDYLSPLAILVGPNGGGKSTILDALLIGSIADPGDGQSPILHFVFSDYSVPVAVAGDGVHALTRLCLELAARPRGTILLEEPETHQHPRAICQTARAIIAAMRGGTQIILTTHSLELIDALLDESSSDELKDNVSLYRMLLSDGQLKSHRHTGDDAAFARSQVEDDLR